MKLQKIAFKICKNKRSLVNTIMPKEDNFLRDKAESARKCKQILHIAYQKEKL